MEKRKEVEEELSQIDEELERLFDRFADLITRRKRLMSEHRAKASTPKAIEKKSPTYVKHHKR